mgnify:CR=1 FL=1
MVEANGHDEGVPGEAEAEPFSECLEGVEVVEVGGHFEEVVDSVPLEGVVEVKFFLFNNNKWS